MATYKAHAKINLFLEVGGKRPDGRHNIQTVFCALDLHDKITFKESKDRGIHITGFGDLKIPKEENIMYKAAERMAARGNINLESDSFEIEVEKNIPLSSGLGGSATDAAPVLRALNKRWEMFLNEEELMKIASNLGADVAVSLQFTKKPGLFIAEGAGEQIKRLNEIEQIEVLIAIPSLYFKDEKTRTLYDLIDRVERTRNKIKGMAKQLEKGEWKGISTELYNAFEQIAFEAYPEIMEIKKKMMRHGAYGTLMSGAGGAVFGLFPNAETADTTEKRMEPLVKKGMIEKLIRTTTL